MTKLVRRGLVVAGPLALLVSGCNLGAAPVVYPSPSRLVEVADVNGDGSLDVVAAGPGAYQVLLNDGTGALQGSPVTTTAEITAFALGDLDNDGLIDRVDVNPGPSGPTVSLARGDGAGGFGAPQVVVPDLQHFGANDVDVVDGDGDGDLEIVTAGRYGILVFSDDGTGHFTRTYASGMEYGSPGSGGYVPLVGTEVMHYDIDHDGDQDLAMAGFIVFDHGTAPSLAHLLNNGAGQFPDRGVGPVGPSSDDAQSPLVGLALADVDEDGRTDIVTGYPATSSVMIRPIRRTDGLRFSVPTPAPPSDVDAADIDDDGHVDLVVTSAGAGTAHVYYGDGTGAFPDSHEVGTGGDAADVVAVGRMDEGSSTDLVFGNDSATADPSVAVLLNKDGRPQH